MDARHGTAEVGMFLPTIIVWPSRHVPVSVIHRFICPRKEYDSVAEQTIRSSDLRSCTSAIQVWHPAEGEDRYGDEHSAVYLYDGGRDVDVRA
jgi:hypothetical protein